MKNHPLQTNFSAGRLTAMSFGFLAGIGGITHGVGEILQGNVAPTGLLIDSWTQGPIAEKMGGDPGMTIIPNLQITGILAIVVSLALTGITAIGYDRLPENPAAARSLKSVQFS